MTINSSQATTHFVDGEKFLDANYVPQEQKCPYIITSIAMKLIFGGFDFRIQHSTPQNVEQVAHVEIAIYVDRLEDAANSFDLGYTFDKRTDDTIVITANTVTITLIQWNVTMDIVLDDSIDCIVEQVQDAGAPNTISEPVKFFDSRRHKLGLTELRSADCPPMYAHRIIDRHDIKRQVKMLKQAFLDYHNMHSLPAYGSLSQNDQQQLSLHGVTPIEVVGGRLAWEREIINTGISFKDTVESIIDDGRVAKYKLSVMHVRINGRNFVICVSKRKIKCVKKSTCILNIFELLTDTIEPYNKFDEVVKYIYSHLINS